MTYRKDGSTTLTPQSDRPRADGGIAEVLAIINRARDVLGRLGSLRDYALGTPPETSVAETDGYGERGPGSLEVLLENARELDRAVDRAQTNLSQLGDALTL